MPLTPTDSAMLALEGQQWRFAGSKEAAIWDGFQISAVRFYQRVNALIDTEAALAHDPILVKRLRRIRAARIR
jgi:hypothetical protein